MIFAALRWNRRGSSSDTQPHVAHRGAESVGLQSGARHALPVDGVEAARRVTERDEPRQQPSYLLVVPALAGREAVRRHRRQRALRARRAGPLPATTGCERTRGPRPRSCPGRRRARPPTSPSSDRPPREAPPRHGTTWAVRCRRPGSCLRSRPPSAGGSRWRRRSRSAPERRAARGPRTTRAGARCARTGRSSRRPGPPDARIPSTTTPVTRPSDTSTRSTTTPSSHPHVVQRRDSATDHLLEQGPGHAEGRPPPVALRPVAAGLVDPGAGAVDPDGAQPARARRRSRGTRRPAGPDRRTAADAGAFPGARVRAATGRR